MKSEIVVPIPYLNLMSPNCAILLAAIRQLSNDGEKEFCKSYREFANDLRLSKRQIGIATTKLVNLEFIECSIRFVGYIKVTHWKFCKDKVDEPVKELTNSKGER